jgi:hypothetical protein
MPSARDTKWLRIVGHVIEPTHNAAGAVHGTAIAAALIASAPKQLDLMTTAIAVPATLVVYWLAFSYAHFLATGISGRADGWVRGLRHSLAEEWSMVENSVLPLIVLLIAAGAGLSIEVATWVALGASVGLLFGWGLLAAARSGVTGGARWFGAGMSAVVGALIIALKVAVKALG